MIEENKKICLDGANDGIIGSTMLCTTFGDAAKNSPGIQIFDRPTDGTKYVMIGKGNYQYQQAAGGVYYVGNSESVNTINLFK